MANTIITKNSSTASAVPSAASLTQGELAVNVTDKKLYTKNASGAVVEITPTNAINATNATTATTTTGNAATATALQTARTIGGVSFNGTANINLPGVNTAGNQSTSGNAATATTLQTARTINGTSFNGSANITTASWGTARTISLTGAVTGSASVDGSANVAIATTIASAPAPTTAQVLSATAGATAGAVGTYAVLARVGGYGGTTVFTQNSTYAGSILKPAVFAFASSSNSNDNIQGSYGSTSPSGTWRCMSAGTSVAYVSPAALFLRIS